MPAGRILCRNRFCAGMDSTLYSAKTQKCTAWRSSLLQCRRSIPIMISSAHCPAWDPRSPRDCWAEIGSDRSRFEDPSALQYLAGNSSRQLPVWTDPPGAECGGTSPTCVCQPIPKPQEWGRLPGSPRGSNRGATSRAYSRKTATTTLHLPCDARA